METPDFRPGDQLTFSYRLDEAPRWNVEVESGTPTPPRMPAELLA